MLDFIMRLPEYPQDSDACSLCLRKAQSCFLNAGLVGNLCGLAVRKQKLIIHISGPEGAVVCRVDSPSGYQTQNSPRAFGQAEDSPVLRGSCSESRGSKWHMQPPDVLCLGCSGLKQN